VRACIARLRDILLIWLLLVQAAAGADVPEQARSAADAGDFASAAELLESRLAEQPHDSEARFLLARVYGWDGRYDAALAEYDVLRALHPQDVDYVFGRALVLNWSGAVDEALEELSRARALAPDYEDVWRVEHSLRVAHPTGTSADQAFRRAARSRFPDADWVAPPPAAETVAGAVTQLSFGAVRESLSRPVPDWNSHFIEVRRLRSRGGSAYGRVQREERFGRRDLLLGGGGDWRISDRWSAGVDLLVGNDNAFMPTWTATGWAAAALANGWEGRLALRHREYDDTQVTSTAWQLGRYFGRFRAAYTIDLARLRGDSVSTAHIGQLNYFVTDRTRLDLTLARGEEAEAIDANRVLRTNVRSVTVGVRQALGERWQLSAWTGSHKQGDLYTRRYVGFSLAAGI
jgi:YaiO family outer membrane protein